MALPTKAACKCKALAHRQLPVPVHNEIHFLFQHFSFPQMWEVWGQRTAAPASPREQRNGAPRSDPVQPRSPAPPAPGQCPEPTRLSPLPPGQPRPCAAHTALCRLLLKSCSYLRAIGLSAASVQPQPLTIPYRMHNHRPVLRVCCCLELETEQFHALFQLARKKRILVGSGTAPARQHPASSGRTPAPPARIPLDPRSR